MTDTIITATIAEPFPNKSWIKITSFFFKSEQNMSDKNIDITKGSIS